MGAGEQAAALDRAACDRRQTSGAAAGARLRFRGLQVALRADRTRAVVLSPDRARARTARYLAESHLQLSRRTGIVPARPGMDAACLAAPARNSLAARRLLALRQQRSAQPHRCRPI